ncbi:MAG: DUF5320 domain-containing protein [Spirochaetota bacterium]
MTGRGAGYCAGLGMPGYTNPGYGRGFGMGFGRGRGAWGRGAWGGRGFGGGGFRGRAMVPFGAFHPWGGPGAYGAPYGYSAPYTEPDPVMEKQALKTQADSLEAELAFIRKRLDEIEAEATG